MNIVSFDSSLRSTGVCVRTPGGCFYETWKYTQKVSRINVLADLYWKMVNLYISLNGEINVVAIEDHAFSKYGSVNSVSPLAEVQGVLKGISAGHGAHVIVIVGSTWKATVGWKTMPKESAHQKLVYCEKASAMFEREFATTDEADAFMMMEAIRVIFCNEKKLTKAGKQIRDNAIEVLKKDDISFDIKKKGGC